MQLQAIIKDALASKSKLTCSEFIQALEAKGVNILFNQASTGYVSGISYSYDGTKITGAKLGNDFKWTSIKGIIDYERERDLLVIHNTSISTKTSNLNSEAETENKPRQNENVGENKSAINPANLENAAWKKLKSFTGALRIDYLLENNLITEPDPTVVPVSTLKLKRKRKRRRV